MSLFSNIIACLVSGLVVIPTTALAQRPVAPWPMFQIDKQLVLQLPTFPIQVDNEEVTKQQMQSFVAQNPQALWILLRKELPATGQLPDLSISYTGLAQATLTHWKAVGVRQASFRVDGLEGLTMDFRIVKPIPGKPSTGTLWVLRVKRTIYVVQWFAQQPDNPNNTSQKQRFLASWQLTQLPINQPTASDFARFHTGKFRDLSQAVSTTTIIRTDTAQIETNTTLNLRISYGLKWTKTGYDLTQRNSSSIHAAVMQPKIIHVRITAVKDNTYWYWATIDGFITTGQIQQVR